MFQGTVGRTDLPGGSYDQLMDSIRNNLGVLPPDTVVYPGHGPTTTIGEELAVNRYF
jgi:glyoxylase-like metal-dependent hydrolase (beta-lactamase superfamily II)